MHVQCPNCSDVFGAKEGTEGKLVRCPSCNQPFRLTPIDDAPKGTTFGIDSAVAKVPPKVAVPSPSSGPQGPVPPVATPKRITCPRCHTEVVTTQSQVKCERCGTVFGTAPVSDSQISSSREPRKIEPPLIIGVAVGIVLIVALVVAATSNRSDTVPSDHEKSVSTTPASRLSRENFLKIHTGMFESDVKLILGEPYSRKIDTKRWALRADWSDGRVEITVWMQQATTLDPYVVTGKTQSGLK